MPRRVTLSARELVQVLERDAGAQELRRVRQAGQLVQRRHRVLGSIHALDAPGLLGVGLVGREQARSVEVQERVEVLDAEGVEACRVALRDVLVAARAHEWVLQVQFVDLAHIRASSASLTPWGR